RPCGGIVSCPSCPIRRGVQEPVRYRASTPAAGGVQPSPNPNPSGAVRGVVPSSGRPSSRRASMKAVRGSWAVARALLVVPAARAQEPPKPGPEHEILKKLAGTWDVTMKGGGVESKGTVTYKMDLGGLWLVSSMESEFG